MAELQDYLADKSGSWSVGDEHLTLLAGFLANKDNRYAPNVPLLTLQILRGKFYSHHLSQQRTFTHSVLRSLIVLAHNQRTNQLEIVVIVAFNFLPLKLETNSIFIHPTTFFHDSIQLLQLKTILCSYYIKIERNIG